MTVNSDKIVGKNTCSCKSAIWLSTSEYCRTTMLMQCQWWAIWWTFMHDRIQLALKASCCHISSVSATFAADEDALVDKDHLLFSDGTWHTRMNTHAHIYTHIDYRKHAKTHRHDITDNESIVRNATSIATMTMIRLRQHREEHSNESYSRPWRSPWPPQQPQWCPTGWACIWLWLPAITILRLKICRLNTSLIDLQYVCRWSMMSACPCVDAYNTRNRSWQLAFDMSKSCKNSQCTIIWNALSWAPFLPLQTTAGTPWKCLRTGMITGFTEKTDVRSKFFHCFVSWQARTIGDMLQAIASWINRLYIDGLRSMHTHKHVGRTAPNVTILTCTGCQCSKRDCAMMVDLQRSSCMAHICHFAWRLHWSKQMQTHTHNSDERANGIDQVNFCMQYRHAKDRTDDRQTKKKQGQRARWRPQRRKKTDNAACAKSDSIKLIYADVRINTRATPTTTTTTTTTIQHRHNRKPKLIHDCHYDTCEWHAMIVTACCCCCCCSWHKWTRTMVGIRLLSILINT